MAAVSVSGAGVTRWLAPTAGSLTASVTGPLAWCVVSGWVVAVASTVSWVGMVSSSVLRGLLSIKNLRVPLQLLSSRHLGPHPAGKTCSDEKACGVKMPLRNVICELSGVARAIEVRQSLISV